jgi:hypothetical protein
MNTSQSKDNELTLFAFDDHSISFTRNLQLEMHQPERHRSNPVVVRGEPGAPDEYGVQFYGSVIQDQGKFRMWYVAVDEDLKNWPDCGFSVWRPAYAESKDGINWTKPNLGLVEYKGSKQNNLIKLRPTSLGIINLKVIRDDDDPDPKRRYKLTSQTWWVGSDGKGGRGTLAPMCSADGYTWDLVGDAHPQEGRLPADSMFLPEHHYEAGSGFYKWKGMYYITGQSNSDHFSHGTTPYSGREILIHRSSDFDHWKQSAHVAFIREGQHQSFKYGHNEETHEGVSVWNRHNVLLGIYGMWHGGEGWAQRTVDLGFLISNDGLHFREPMTEWTMIHRGNDNEWDQGGVLQGQGFANVGDKTYLYYGAWDPRPGGIDPGDVYPPRGGVGLATIERDRFGSLSPRDGASLAEFVTGEIEIPAQSTPEFFINVDGLGNKASLHIEILDDLEQSITCPSDKNIAIVSENGFRIKIDFPTDWIPRNTSLSIRLHVSFQGIESRGIHVSALYVAIAS